jgi:sterol desaturase/sphingolipid hydroxylase (fatty acid hydroxylase superfamily)
MILQDLLGPAVPVTYLALLVLEAAVPARDWPAIGWWRLTGGIFFLTMGGIVTTGPLLLPGDWIARHRLFDLTGLGVAGGFIVGYLGLTFVFYWFHRAEHAVEPLWRGLHQLHHAPQRVDLSGFAFTHPVEMLATSLIAALTTTLVFGVDPRAAAVAGYVHALSSMIQHLNVATPRWLAAFFQRPEAHGLHHERGVHGRNFGDLPLWDMLFGTFANPPRFTGQAGFDEPAAHRVGAMLFFADVNGARSLGRPSSSHEVAA